MVAEKKVVEEEVIGGKVVMMAGDSTDGDITAGEGTAEWKERKEEWVSKGKGIVRDKIRGMPMVEMG